MADDLAGLIVPGTPLLVPGVDRREPPELTHLRDRIADLLRESDTWVVPLAATAVPPLLSLGGLGIDAGARVRMSPGCGRVGPAELVTGTALAEAVDGLDTGGAEQAAGTSTGVVVGALLAAAAGADVHLHPCGGESGTPPHPDRPAGPLLVPVDFSAAAHPDAPLAPREGADAFDERLEQALTGPLERAELRALGDAANRFAAALEPLGLIDPEGLRGEVDAAVDVHRVRYRLIRLTADGGPRP